MTLPTHPSATVEPPAARAAARSPDEAVLARLPDLRDAPAVRPLRQSVGLEHLIARIRTVGRTIPPKVVLLGVATLFVGLLVFSLNTEQSKPLDEPPPRWSPQAAGPSPPATTPREAKNSRPARAFTNDSVDTYSPIPTWQVSDDALGHVAGDDVPRDMPRDYPMHARQDDPASPVRIGDRRAADTEGGARFDGTIVKPPARR